MKPPRKSNRVTQKETGTIRSTVQKSRWLIAAVQTFDLQFTPPAIRAVWSVVDQDAWAPKEKRRRKRP